jgi:hypothetical protein
MRASTRERMISIMALVMVIGIGFLVPKAAAQSDKYPKMAPVEQYLMETNAEILLARSAAPDSISSDATILVLGRQGYETAVRGKKGLPPILVFAVEVAKWSDGTAAPMHQE